MRAVVLDPFHAPLHVAARPVPDTPAGGAVVRVRAVGVCRSDLHVVDGYFPSSPLPLVLGHEVTGEVDGLGTVLVQHAPGLRRVPLLPRRPHRVPHGRARAAVPRRRQACARDRRRGRYRARRG